MRKEEAEEPPLRTHDEACEEDLRQLERVCDWLAEHHSELKGQSIDEAIIGLVERLVEDFIVAENALAAVGKAAGLPDRIEGEPIWKYAKRTAKDVSQILQGGADSGAVEMVRIYQQIQGEAWKRTGDILPKDDPAQACHERLRSHLKVLIDGWERLQVIEDAKYIAVEGGVGKIGTFEIRTVENEKPLGWKTPDTYRIPKSPTLPDVDAVAAALLSPKPVPSSDPKPVGADSLPELLALIRSKLSVSPDEKPLITWTAKAVLRIAEELELRKHQPEKSNGHPVRPPQLDATVIDGVRSFLETINPGGTGVQGKSLADLQGQVGKIQDLIKTKARTPGDVLKEGTGEGGPNGQSDAKEQT